MLHGVVVHAVQASWITEQYSKAQKGWVKLGEDKWQDLGLGDVNFKIYKAQLLQGLGDPRFSLVEKTHPVHPEKRSIFGNEVYISMDLLLIHLCEGGEELLKMLRRSLIAVGDFGPVYEGHLESLGPKGNSASSSSRAVSGGGGRLGTILVELAVAVEDGLRLPRMSGRKSSKPAPHFNARLPVSNTVKEGTKPRRQSQRRSCGVTKAAWAAACWVEFSC